MSNRHTVSRREFLKATGGLVGAAYFSGLGLAETKPRLPKCKIGDYEISKLVLGTNPFIGIAHFSVGRAKFLDRYFTVDRVVEVMEACYDLGMNAIFGPPSEKLVEALKRVRKKGRKMLFISQAWGSQKAEDQRRDIEWLKKRANPEICMPHSGYVDAHLNEKTGEVEGLEDLLKLIEKLDMVPTVSTHNPETVVVCDKAGYNIKAYTMPLNDKVYICNNPERAAWVIKNTDKVIITIKPLAAGRLTPGQGLNYVFPRIKEKDIVAIGIIAKEEAEEDVQITEEILKKPLL